jgi:hypothetical protein
MPIRTAINSVWGQIRAGCWRGWHAAGWDANNWAPWGRNRQPARGLEDAAHGHRALRPGKGFLVYGRAALPVQVDGIRTVEWTHQGAYSVLSTPPGSRRTRASE